MSNPRVIWLNISRVPLHAWHATTFETIAKLWGTIMEIDDAALFRQHLHHGRVCVMTSSLQWINYVATLLVEGVPYKVKVMEDSGEAGYGQSSAKGTYFPELESENEADDEVIGRSEFWSENENASEEESSDDTAGKLQDHGSRVPTPPKKRDNDNSVDS